MRLSDVDPTVAVPFEAFVVARGPALVRFAHALSGDAHLAEDLVQEVLAKVHRRWSRIESSPEAYVRSAICRELVSWRRRRSAHEQPGPIPDTALPEQANQLAERDLMWRALATLSPRQRSVLVLRYWEGLTDHEVAVLLGVSPGTVRSLASRAFTTLRTHPQLEHMRVPEATGGHK